jgi:hypothetical protein
MKKWYLIQFYKHYSPQSSLNSVNRVHPPTQIIRKKWSKKVNVIWFKSIPNHKQKKGSNKVDVFAMKHRQRQRTPHRRQHDDTDNNFFFIYTPIIIWKNGIIQYNYIYRCQTSNTDAVLHSVFNLKFGPIFANNLVQREYNSVNSKNKNFTHPYLFKHPIQHSLSKNNKQWNSKYIHNFKTFLNTNIHQNKFNIEDWIRVLSNYQIPHKKILFSILHFYKI